MRLLGIEDHGQAETRERRNRGDFTGADSRATEASTGGYPRQVVRQAAQIRSLEPRNAHRLHCVESTVLVAALACFVRIGNHAEAIRLEQASNLLLLLFSAHLRHRSREILRGEILLTAPLDCDTDRVNVAI